MEKLDGIHHISSITADATKNLLFYEGVMGLRLVKKTVNQDNPSVYHLF
jgi:glyoxalase family protein